MREARPIGTLPVTRLLASALAGAAVACVTGGMLLVLAIKWHLPGSDLHYWLAVLVSAGVGSTVPIAASPTRLRLAIAIGFVPCAVVIVALFSIFFGCWLTGDCP